MQCDICFRTGGHRLPFLCPTDARNQLYEIRVQAAGVHLEKDALDREITRGLQSASSKKEGHGDGQPAITARSNYDTLVAEREQSLDRTNQIIAHADELKAKLERAKEERSKKKAANDRRRAELISASSGVEPRRTKQVQDTESSTRRTRYRWNQTHHLIAGSRAYLCYETAKLYGLEKIRKPNGSEEYKIGGVSIIDLRLLNSAYPSLYIEAMLTMIDSCKPCPDFHLPVSHHPCPHASYSLSCHSITCRSNPSSSRLSLAHDILFTVIICVQKCTISWEHF